MTSSSSDEGISARRLDEEPFARFDFQVQHAMLGSLPVKCRSPLCIDACDIDLRYEYVATSKDLVGRAELKRHIFLIDFDEITRIMVHDKEEPHVIFIVPTESWSKDFNNKMNKVVVDTSCDCDIPAKQQLIFFLEPINDSAKNELRAYLYAHQRLHLFKYEVLDLKGAQRIISGVGNRKLECNECSPSDTTDTLGFELVVKYFQFGNAKCVCHSPLFLNYGADDEIVLECIFQRAQGEKKEIAVPSVGRLYLSFMEVDKIIIKCDSTELQIVVLLSKRCCYDPMFMLTFMCRVLAPELDIPTKKEIVFHIQSDPTLFKKVIQQHLIELENIAPVSIIGSIDTGRQGPKREASACSKRHRYNTRSNKSKKMSEE